MPPIKAATSSAVQRNLLDDFDEILSDTAESTAVMTPMSYSSAVKGMHQGADGRQGKGTVPQSKSPRDFLLAVDLPFFAVDIHMQQSLALLDKLGYSAGETFSGLLKWIDVDQTGALDDLETFIKDECAGKLPVYARKLLAALRRQ